MGYRRRKHQETTPQERNSQWRKMLVAEQEWKQRYNPLHRDHHEGHRSHWLLSEEDDQNERTSFEIAFTVLLIAESNGGTSVFYNMYLHRRL